MSKYQAEKAIRAELELVNKIIDQRIIQGRSYKREAQRHKILLAQLARMSRAGSVKSGWFGRSLRYVSTFML